MLSARPTTARPGARLAAARPHPPSRRPRRRRPVPSPPRSLLGVDADGTGGVSTALMVAGIAGALALSAAPLLTGASARRNAATEADRARRLASGDPGAPLEEEEAEASDVKWGAASVIACVPVLNWLVRERGRRFFSGGEGGRGRVWGRGGDGGLHAWRRVLALCGGGMTGRGERSAPLARRQRARFFFPSQPHPSFSVSLSPLSQAWVFAALTEEDRAPIYWLFAALYAAPALHNGLGVDGLSLAATAACAAHIQLERARPDVATARLALPPVDSLADAARLAGGAAAGAGGGGQGGVGGGGAGGGRGVAGWWQQQRRRRRRRPVRL